MKEKFLKISMTLMTLVALILAIVSYMGQKKMAFIDYNEVYNNCDLKLKLEKDLQKVANARKSELDSLQMELSFLSEKIKGGNTSKEEIGKFDDMKNRFLTYQQKYEEENIRLKETYFTQIRQEINEKSKEYSIKHGYDYFFSAIGEGSLMYAAESEDVTKDFQKFIDNK
jgi:Skp family chaperone for outer membrane proteins